MKKFFIKSFCFFVALLISATTEIGFAQVTVPAGADLAAVISENAGETVFNLEGAEYTVSDITFSRNVTIQGVADRTKITTTGTFLIENGSTIENILFRKIDFAASGGYVFNTISSQAYNLGSITFDDCTFQGYQRSVFRVQNTGAIVGEIIVDNCVFKNWASNADAYCLFQSSIDSKLGKLVIQNSTFANLVNSGIVRWGNYTGSMDVLVDNCTFYGVGNSGNVDALFRFNAAANSNIIISNNIFAKTNNTAAIEGLRYASSATVSTPNNYGTSDFMQTTTADRRINLTAYPGTSADLFVDPTATPFDFSIKDAAFEGIETAGDPRWKKTNELADNEMMIPAGTDLRTQLGVGASADPPKTVFYLQGAEYSLSSSYNFPRGVTLIGAPDRTKIVTTEYFSVTGGVTYDQIKFEGIDFVRPSGTSHLFTSGSSVTYNLGTLIFENCSFEGYPDAVIRGRASGVVIGEIIIDNCIFKNLTGTSAVVSSNDASVPLSKLTIKNSTFVNVTYQIVRWNLYAGEMNVEVDNCTFYDVGTVVPLFNFGAASATSSITISDCIFAKGKNAAMQMVGAPNVTTGVVSTNNYRTSDFTLHATDNLIDLNEYSGNSDALFLAPTQTPFDFYVKAADFTGKATAGDPRWMYTDAVILEGSCERGGTVSPAFKSYEKGSDATVTAIPAAGFEFKEWQIGGAPVSEENPYTFAINTDTEIVAVFEVLAMPKITTSVSPARAGKIIVTPDQTEFLPGDEVALEAAGFFGYRFKEWQIDGKAATANPYSFHITDDTEIVAVFEPSGEAPKETPVTPENFVEKYLGTIDGEVLLMDEGIYTATSQGLLPFPQEKIITLKAADGKDVRFEGFIGGTGATTGNPTSDFSRGGIIFDGLDIVATSNFIIEGSPIGNIDIIAFRNSTLRRATLGAVGGRGICDISNAGAVGKIVGLYEITNCFIRDIGTSGQHFFRANQLVGNVLIKNSTFYNSPANSLLTAQNGAKENTGVDVSITFENNTVYKWGTQNDEFALLGIFSRTGSGDESTARRIYENATINIKNNIIAHPYAFGATVPDPVPVLPNLTLAPAATGAVNATNNLVLYYGDYLVKPTYANTSNRNFMDQEWLKINTPVVADLVWATLFPDKAVANVKVFFKNPDGTDPDNPEAPADPSKVDFSIDPTSPLLTAGAGGGPIGDPRWMDFTPVTDITLSQTALEMTEGDEVTLTAVVTPANATFKNVVWSSSNPNVATVEDGKVIAIGTGKATIKATAIDGSNVFAACEVTVIVVIEGTQVDPETFIAAYQAAIADPSTDDVIFVMSEGDYVASEVNTLIFPSTKTITLMAEKDAHVTLRARFEAAAPTPETADKAGGLIFDGLDIIHNVNQDFVVGSNIGNITIYAFRNCTIRKADLGGTSSQRGFGLFSHADVYNKTFGLFEISNCIVRDIGTNNNNLLLSCHHTKEIKIVNSTFWNSASQTLFMGLENGQTELEDGVKKEIKITVENNTFFRWGRFGSDEHGLIKIYGRLAQSDGTTGVQPITGTDLPASNAQIGRKGYSDAAISMRNNIFAQPENLDMALNPPVVGPFINGDDKVIASYTFYPNMLMLASVANTKLDASNNLVLYYGNVFNGSTGGYERNPTYPTATNRFWVEPAGRDIILNRTGADLDWAMLFPSVEKADVSHFFAHSGMKANPDFDPENPASRPTVYDYTLVDFEISTSSPLATASTEGGPIGDPRWIGGGVIQVSKVELDQTELFFAIGVSDPQTLTATVSPSVATNKIVTWASSNSSVATVVGTDNTATVTAVGVGEAIITVTTNDGGKTATCVIHVSADAVNVTGVTLSQTTLELQETNSETLTPVITPTHATNKNVTWVSSAPEFVTVSASGLVTAVKVGQATITVTTNDGNHTATCAVTVVAKPVTGVTLNKNATSLLVGADETLVPTIAPSTATNKSVTWASSDDAIATVVAGKVTGVKAGTATITVTTVDGNHTATCTVTVIQPATGVTLDKNTLNIVLPGTGTLTATVAPADATNKAVTWSSSDPNVAIVSAGGMVTANAGGITTITVTTVDGSFTATCEVTVIIPVTGISLNESVLTVKAGEPVTLVATVAPSNATNKAITWSSSDPTVATVANGVVSGVKAGGPVYITATTVDGGKSANCVITVTGGGVTGVEITDAQLAHVYPNPTDGWLTLEFETLSVYTVTITDMAGKVLMRQLIADQKAQLDISNYTAGVYLLVIDNGKQQSTMRIVKN